MNKKMKAHAHTKSAVLCLVAALSISIGSPLYAQAPKEAGGKMMMHDQPMTESCQAMMKHKQQMMAEIQSEDARLVEQVAKLDGAPEEKKVSLMADILTKLVNQRADMHDRMGKMQNMMMRHTMMHMRMGKDSLDECPMLKDSMGGKDKSGTPDKKQ